MHAKHPFNTGAVGRGIETVRRAIVFGLLSVGYVLLIGCGGTSDSSATTGNSPTASPADEQKGASAVELNLIPQAVTAMQAGDLSNASELLKQQLLVDPQDSQAMELSGDIAAQSDKKEQAATLYQAALDVQPKPSAELLNKLAQLRMVQGKAFDALSVLEKATQAHPTLPQFKFDLAGLSAMLGVPGIAKPSLVWLAQRQMADADSWTMLADPSQAQPDDVMCKKLLQRCPDDLRPHFSLALIDASKMRWGDVAKILEPVVEQHQDFVPAYALYGRALVELGQNEKVAQWQNKLPAGIDQSPTYWVAAGVWAQNQKQHKQAARAFWEALRLDESGQDQALNRLLLSLGQIDRKAEAKIVADKIDKFATMRDAMGTFLERDRQSQQAAMDVAAAMESLGRIWEAEGWARFAGSLPKDKVADGGKIYQGIRAKMTVKTPWQLPETMIANQIDLSDLPDVAWATSTTSSISAETGLAMDAFRLSDQAKQRGLQFTCEIDPEATEKGHWIYQSVGGGVGVIDLDLDGWPDLTLAMLDGKPMKSDSKPNGLFRNQAGNFVNVSNASGYDDHGFGQGIAIGDFNGDGFPDVLDCNIGRNRLFRNNGDGTLTDVSDEVGLSAEHWTASAAIADIDNDGNADIYEVAYCRGKEPYERLCKREDKISTCPPLVFEPELDRVFKGRGDGTFVDVTDQWLDQKTPGRGLGVVVGQLDESPGLDLYIANDMTVNHLWSPTVSDDQEFQLADLATVRGLAFSGRSLSQASMGMAVGDPDSDGDIDFFLTHFSDDHNTYYEQVGPGLWSDRSFQVGLSEPSRDLLGFGTEWIDFDNNGTPELMIANGHVNVAAKDGGSPKMRAQLFHMSGSGQWAENQSDQLGDYFQTNHIGRALVPLDANHDGNMDVLVTHMYEPVSLLVNQTQQTGRSVGIVLSATRGQRDAIGATISMKVGSRTVHHQLTAGDGYMCSNQRRISVGAGTSKQADDVTITWPSGTVQKLGTLKTSADYLVVEDAEQAFLLFDHES